MLGAMTKHADTRRGRIRATLQDAIDQTTCVRLTTRDGDDVVGYCVGVGRRWCLVALAAPWPDGYAAVRLAALERIHRVEPATVERRAFERDDRWPPAAPEDLDLDRTDALLAGLADRFPLVGLDLRDSEDDVFVGAPALVAEGTLMLQELGSDAQWDALSAWRLRDITRVTVHDRYLQLLADLAPPQPQQPSPFSD